MRAAGSGGGGHALDDVQRAVLVQHAIPTWDDEVRSTIMERLPRGVPAGSRSAIARPLAHRDEQPGPPFSQRTTGWLAGAPLMAYIIGK